MEPRFSNDIPELFRNYVERCAQEPALSEDLTRKALADFSSYEGVDVQVLFLLTHLPAGKVLLSGAGPGSLFLMRTIEHQAPHIQILALVDRRAQEIRELHGYEVITAQQAATREFDYAIVCNVVYGKSMAEDLLHAGISASRIQVVHALQSYRELQERFVEDVLEKRLLTKIHQRVAKVENVIIVPSRDIWSVVDECVLVEALPAESTIRLYFGPSSNLEISPQYPTFDMEQSLPLLLNLLKKLRPKCVYVRGSAQFQAQTVAVAIKQTLPEAFLTFEIYDYMCMFDSEILNGWSFDPQSVHDNRCAEALMCRVADFIFDKTPGPGWHALASSLVTAPRRAFFPRLQSQTPPSAHTPRARKGPLQLLCAGTFPEFRRYQPGEGFLNSVFQDIVQPIEQLSAFEDFHIDIFNSGHVPGSPGCEREYCGYRTHFDARRVSYNTGIPFDQLLARMSEYDFGILLFSPTDMVIDYPLQESLPNRFMGYVSGDLPIIINREIRYSAQLVERFNAGIVIGVDELADLPRRIREADLPRMREGVRALRQFMHEHNRSAILAFKQALATRGGDAPYES